jgi:uncharacterized coiled-coil DUF342 family protein
MKKIATYEQQLDQTKDWLASQESKIVKTHDTHRHYFEEGLASVNTKVDRAVRKYDKIKEKAQTAVDLVKNINFSIGHLPQTLESTNTRLSNLETGLYKVSNDKADKVFVDHQLLEIHNQIKQIRQSLDRSLSEATAANNFMQKFNPIYV